MNLDDGDGVKINETSTKLVRVIRLKPGKSFNFKKLSKFQKAFEL
jgi:hypothetical protein